MKMPKFGTSQIELDSTKILSEDENEIVLPARLAREAVLSYAQGRAYRPKSELKTSLFTFEAWCVPRKHPEHLLLTKTSEVNGRVTNIEWDEAQGLVKGHVHLFKPKNDPAFLADVKEGRLKDVSIGFIYDEDWTPGEWNGQRYDFVQRNLFINHVAVGVPRGRMTSPQIGLGLDAALEGVLNEFCIAADPWEENENTIRSGHGNPDKAATCRTKVLSETQGISLVVCEDKNTGKWYDQSFLFNKAKGWTMDKAKAWFASHTGNDSAAWFITAAVDELARSLGHVVIVGAADSSGSGGSGQTAAPPPPAAGQQPGKTPEENKPPPGALGAQGKPSGTPEEQPPAKKPLPDTEALLAENKRIRELAQKVL
jgi:hypothetical protein